MKKLLFVFAAIIAAFTLNSCEPVISGDFTYCVRPAKGTETALSMLWQLKAEKIVVEEIAKVAKPAMPGLTNTWTISGHKKDCDSQIINALNNAITRTEQDPAFKGSLLNGVTIVILTGTNDKGESLPSIDDFLLYKRAYNL